VEGRSGNIVPSRGKKRVGSSGWIGVRIWGRVAQLSEPKTRMQMYCAVQYKLPKGTDWIKWYSSACGRGLEGSHDGRAGTVEL
jgi:hypothetical protein